ncbi:Amidophosphoribosyltransferase [compost metagenome]
MNTNSDSEVLLNVFAHELAVRNKLQPTEEDVFAAVAGVHARCVGGYAVVAMITGYGVVGFRDPNAIRPIVFGQRHTENGMEYMIASESVALDVLGFTLIRDLAPGEAVYITEEGKLYTRQCATNPKYSPCIFEHVYLARPDSIMDGVSVYKARLRMGEKLADKILRERPDHDIDVVIPIPDTSRTSALELANRLGVKFREGFVKNRYIGRTFIMPGQAARKKSVRQKLNAIDLEFRGKNVMLVDDSIVRGTTCKQIIQMAREAGAKKVYFCSAAPAVRYPNVYGIDMPSVHELIAHDRSTDDVCELIGADWLVYQDLPDLIDAVGGGKIKIENFDCAVFDGQYVTGDVDEAYLNKIEQARNDATKAKGHAVSAIIDLYND